MCGKEIKGIAVENNHLMLLKHFMTSIPMFTCATVKIKKQLAILYKFRSNSFLL